MLFWNFAAALMLFVQVNGDCPSLGSIQNAEYACGKNFQRGSVCDFECFTNMVAKQNMTITCLDNDTWDSPPPTCEEPCIKNLKADIVFVMDSSTSLRRVTQTMMKDFVKHMIKDFTISPEYVQVAIVPYSRYVVSNSVVLFNQYPDSKENIIEVLDNLPVNGRGSLTWRALDYVIDVILSEESGNRPDVPDIVVTLSDGRGRGNLLRPLRQLWKMGVSTYSVGFHPRIFSIQKQQLLTLAAYDARRMHITDSASFGNLEVFRAALEEEFCEVTKPEPGCWPLPPVPENAIISCSESHGIGSVCEMVCKEGYSLVGDQPFSTCEDREGSSKWTEMRASCLAPLSDCPDIGPLDHGMVLCDDSGLECQFECTESGFRLYPDQMNHTNCGHDGTWTSKKPCCARPCPPYARMDAVFVLDSSSSVGKENWAILKNFVIDLVRSFELGEYGARFAIFRYNSGVDTDTEIKLGDFPADKDGLLQAINAIPYDGFGTLTGQALLHAQRYVLRNGRNGLSHGNRPDVPDAVIVITDGWSRDSVKEVSQELRDAGVQMYGVGIQRRGKRSFNTSQILDISGTPDRMFLAESGFAQLAQSFREEVVSSICANPCEGLE